MAFNLEKTDTDSKARVGTITTAHGVIQTPIFMPVGTVGSVKAVTQSDLTNSINAQIILGNTYHLYLRPGTQVLDTIQGLHNFMHWDKPILTDSGGYQVYSLSQRRKISDEGVSFSSHIDGSKHLFTPEKVVDIQRSIQSDITMAFDECTPYPCTHDYASKSLKLTKKWLLRGSHCFNAFEGGPKQIFVPIIQGSSFKDLRKQATEDVQEVESSIYAIGGLSVGEPEDIMYDITDFTTDLMPVQKARYLMGVGTPTNLLQCIARGIDMFDCVLPTRNARHGLLYTAEGTLHIKNNKWKDVGEPIDANSPAESSRMYSRAYLRHLFISGEILALQIASIHNLAFYLQLVSEARKQIEQGTFTPWKNDMLLRLNQKI